MGRWNAMKPEAHFVVPIILVIVLTLAVFVPSVAILGGTTVSEAQPFLLRTKPWRGGLCLATASPASAISEDDPSLGLHLEECTGEPNQLWTYDLGKSLLLNQEGYAVEPGTQGNVLSTKAGASHNKNTGIRQMDVSGSNTSGSKAYWFPQMSFSKEGAAEDWTPFSSNAGHYIVFDEEGRSVVWASALTRDNLYSEAVFHPDYTYRKLSSHIDLGDFTTTKNPTPGQVKQ